MAESADAEISEISALVREAQAGRDDAFAELLRLFQARLHRQALFLARNESEALDLLQETVLEGWKHLGRFDGRASFFTWLCSIMAHRHYDWLRRVRTRAFGILNEAPGENVPEESLNPGQMSVERDNARVMRESLDQLPSRQRMVIYLRFYAGESLDGIAAILQCSPGTVKSRLFHGLRRLAKMEKLKQLRNE